MQKFIFILFIQTIHQCFATVLTCGDLKVVYNDNCQCADDSSSSFCVNNGFQTTGSVTHIVDWQQVGIGTEIPHNSAALEITSTTKGFLMPRMTEDQRNTIQPATGLMIYQTNKEPGFYYHNGISWEGIANGQPTTYNIGDIVNGGVVFWLDSTGQHGLVTAFSDFGYSDVATSVQWGCLDTDLPNVPNVFSVIPVGFGAGIGAGFDNTNDILTDCPNAPAALSARALGAQWFLPSIKELNQMAINKIILEGVSGFTAFSNSYWSSTEHNSSVAWSQSFDNGNQNASNKGYAYDVRAVRAF